MHALLDRGFIDIEHPGRSRLFEQTQFSGPMYRVFSDDERAVIIDWIESLRGDGEQVVRPEPLTHEEPRQPELVESDRGVATAVSLIADEVRQAAQSISAERRLPERPASERAVSERHWRIGMGSPH